MFLWLKANAATIIISAVLLIAVAAIIRGMVRSKVSICGGDCSACGGHSEADGDPVCKSCPHSGACGK